METADPLGQPVHVFYVHSPITYSMALAVIRLRHIAEPVLIGGRCMAGPGFAGRVRDDGIWSVDRTLDLLRCIAERLPPRAPVVLYLPHTAFLFGKLVKISHRVAGIVYLEEGYTSAQASVLTQPTSPTPVPLDVLVPALERQGLGAAWGFDEAALARLNELPERVLDTHTAKYAGAYACSADAFAGMANVTRLELAVHGAPRPEHLLSFFALSNRYLDEALEEACALVCEIVCRMREQAAPAHPQLVKLHPMDYGNLPGWFLAEVSRHGGDYFDHCIRNGIDPNVEPALLNFDHYFLFGKTAQAKYIENFLGAERLSSFATMLSPLEDGAS